jgi:prepilin-type N-terminal cleavage/methylation domain-containing protein
MTSPLPFTSLRTPVRRAFTLIELIAVMVVVAAIGAVASLAIQRAGAAVSQVATRGTLYAEASAAMDRVTRLIQTTPTRTGASGVAPSIASFTASTISWDSQSRIEYDAVAHTVVLRDVASGDAVADSPVLVANTTSFSLVPLDASNTNLFTTLGVTALSAAQGESVRRVEVQFTMTREGQSVTLRSRAFLRCTMAGVSP